MKSFVLIPLCFCLVASTSTKPPVFLSYQDSLGQYSFGYSEPMSARSEYRGSDGLTRGTYSYIDQNGLIQTAEYEAGKELGFRIKATNLPEAPLPVSDTPEVIAARERHLKILAEKEKEEREENERMAMMKIEEMKRMSGAELPVIEAKVARTDPINEAAKVITVQTKIIEQMPESKSVEPEIPIIEARIGGFLKPVFETKNAGSVASPIEAKNVDPIPSKAEVKSVEPVQKVRESMPVHQEEKSDIIPEVKSAMEPAKEISEEIPKVESKVDISARSNANSIILPQQQQQAPVIASGIPPSIDPGMQLRMAPVMAPGMSPSMAPGLQPGMAPDMALGMSRGMGPSMLPESVTYTPEVMAAREAHFRAHANAARLAAETDANPRLLEQLLRGYPTHVPVLTGNKLDDVARETMMPHRPMHGFPVPAIRNPIMGFDAVAQRIGSPQTPMFNNKKLDMNAANLAAKVMIKNVERPSMGPALTPAGTSLRIMDVRLPTLNEFQQSKLKAGGYRTPIEISHVSPTNVVPTNFPSYHGNSAFHYVYI